MGVSSKWTAALGRSSVGVGCSVGRRQREEEDKEEEEEEEEHEQQQQQEQPRQQRRRRRGSGVAVAAAEQRPTLQWLDVEASALAAATTSVAVMAPALTEGGPQKPENLLPALPAGGFLTVEQAKQVCQNREVLAQFVVSANVQPSEIDEQCLTGIPKGLLDDVINLKFGSGLDGLSDLIAAGAPRKESVGAMSDPSMGDDDPVDNNMCYYKTTNMGPSGEQNESCEMAEVDGDVQAAATAATAGGGDGDDRGAQVAEHEAAATASDEDRQIAEDIIGFTDINVQADDLIDGIISMNNEPSQQMLSGDSRLIDGCGLMENAIPSQSTSDGVSEIFSDNEGFPLSLNLLNDVDMMGLMGNENMSDNGIGVADQLHSQQQEQLILHRQQQEAAKLAELTRHRTQVERQQHELERRTAFLLRRLRKFQSQLVGLHAAEEAGHVLELAQKSARKFLHQDLASLGQRAGGNARNFPELVGNISSFLQKVQKSCNAQSNSVAVRNRNACRYFGAGSRDNYVNTNVNRTPAFGVPQIRLDGKQVEQVAGPLATKLKILQNAYDSDCTESSSGGESCDEMQTFNNPHQQQLPILKRASWRWAQDRASVAARWTWLQAQISDLEFRIRQHSDYQRQIRTTKGLVMLEAPATALTTSTPGGIVASSAAAAAASAAASTMPPSFGPESTLNGYSGALHGATTPAGAAAAAAGTLSPGVRTACGLEAGFESSGANLGSSRCRPYVRHTFRKRKLLRLEGLHLHSKKAARPSNIKCDCDGRLAYCALCTGRRDPTASQDTELMSVQERLALVDPGYHPVLSMPDETTVSAHADAILRIPEWQQRMARGGVRASKMKDKDGNERRNRRSSEQRSKCPSRLKKSQTALISSSIKRKILKGKRSRNNSERTNSSGAGRKRPTKQAQLQMQTSSTQPQSQQQQPQLQLPAPMLDDEEEAVSALSSSSKYSSPVPSPLLQQQTGGASAATPTSGVPPTTLKEKSSNSHSRLRQNSYDIDNIVIPYSVASSTRLEKLPYKEIIIPQWRVCNVSPQPGTDVKNGAMQKSHPDSDNEDISDEAIALRHERSEKEEAKRFMNFTHLPYQSRLRRDRRPDYRSESGANTPDPMSPHASDCGGDAVSPITSPPPTPGTIPDPEHADAYHRAGSFHNALRRKISTRSQKEEAPAIFNEEEEEQQVLPYEPRTFPLTDEDFCEMKKEMPIEHQREISSTPICPLIDNIKEDEAEVYCQESDSTESAVCDNEGEDPNDPEWTITEAREMEKERIRPTVKR